MQDSESRYRDLKSAKSETDFNARWYFAYGSNLNPSVFLTRRGIKPLDFRVAFLQDYKLCFNILFMPYSDPAMAGLGKCGPNDSPVYGVEYLLTQHDFRKLVSSEGGGVAYKVIEADANILAEKMTHKVSTLIARRELSFANERFPSERYLDLLIKGALEQSLPGPYQKRLLCQQSFRASRAIRWRLGRWLFNLTWYRISAWVQWGTQHFKNDNGNVPSWFLLIFDALLWAMWVEHDYILAPIFGRGDGR